MVSNFLYLHWICFVGKWTSTKATPVWPGRSGRGSWMPRKKRSGLLCPPPSPKNPELNMELKEYAHSQRWWSPGRVIYILLFSLLFSIFVFKNSIFFLLAPILWLGLRFWRGCLYFCLVRGDGTFHTLRHIVYRQLPSCSLEHGGEATPYLDNGHRHRVHHASQMLKALGHQCQFELQLPDVRVDDFVPSLNTKLIADPQNHN